MTDQTPTSPDAPISMSSDPDADAQRWVVLLVDYADPAKDGWGDFDETEKQAVMQQHVDFSRAVAARPGCRIVAGEALAGGHDAVVFRRRDGRTVLTEGSFAESVEQIGGFYLMEAPDLDTLVGLLEVMPTYVMEIRPTASE